MWNGTCAMVRFMHGIKRIHFRNRIHFQRWLGIVPMMYLAACSRSVPPPEKTIETLYAPYVSHAVEHGESTWEKSPVYSKNFKAAIDRGFEYSLLLNEPVIDFDPIANAQDFSITNIRIEVDHPVEAGKAHVLARFNNGDRKTAVGYDMVLEDGTWKVDGIRGGDQELRKIIDDALKPIGDPQAMKAPVERIYMRYGEPAKVEPLYRWAPLTDTLRDKLKKAESKSIALGFDPVCGGPPCIPSDLKLEAVSGGVIARFHADGQNRVAVYDVVKQAGAWFVDDIHAPGNPPWDLVQRLEEMGIH
jgi:Protein of unknown function (DUF3828)